MAEKATGLEATLERMFVQSAPKLPAGGKKALVEWAPIIGLIVGILNLVSAWSLWHWARMAENIGTYASQICRVYAGYNCGIPSVSRFSVWLWLGILSLAIEGFMYLLAYSGLKDRTKQGWNYLYYGALLNVAYAIVSLFAAYDVLGHFVGALIGSAIGFYLLFQIRDAYVGAHKRSPAAIDTPTGKEKS